MPRRHHVHGKGYRAIRWTCALIVCAPAQLLTAADLYWVSASGPSWSDAANWAATSGGAGGAGVPGPGDDVHFDGGSAVDCLIDQTADVAVAGWIQDAAYAGTVTVPTTYAGGFRTLAITGDCLLDGGTWTHPGNPSGRTYRLNVAVGGILRVGAAARIDAGGAGYASGGARSTTITLTATNNSGGDQSSFIDDVQVISPQTPVFANAGFETPDASAYPGFIASPPGVGWTFISPSGVARYGGGYNLEQPLDGVQVAYIQGGLGTVGGLAQSIAMRAGTYRVRMHMSYRSHFGGTQPLQMSVNGRPIGSPIAPATTRFSTYLSDAFTVPTGTALIRFDATISTSDCTSFVDALEIVPEGAPAFRNPGFEQPPLVTPPNYVYQVTGAEWDFNDRAVLQRNGSAWGAPDAFEGIQTLALQSDTGITLGGVSQVIALPAGSWKLRFLGARRGYGANQPIRVLADGVPVGADYLPSSPSSWDIHETAAFSVGIPAATGEGGAHGGRGGAGGGHPGGSAPTYGQPTAPIEPGSGSAGAGGGAIRLAVAGAATIDGSVSASGADDASGAGAGGSIWLSCATLAGGGGFAADGGGSSGAGGAGGGGRISVVVGSGTDFAGTTAHAAGGAASGTGGNGAAGTIYLQHAGEGAGNGQLVIDNRGRGTAAPVVTALNDGDALTGAAQDAAVAVGSLAVRGAARVLIGAGDTLAISGVAPDDGIAGGLVGRWRLEDGSGGTAVDDTGTADGAITGGAWTTGQFAGGWAAHYQDGRDYIEMPWTALQDVQGGSHTLSLWVRLATRPPWTMNYDDFAYGLLMKPGYHHGLYATAPGDFDLDRWTAGPTNLLLSAGPWSVQRYHHVVSTVDQATGISVLYVNGRQVDSRTDAANVPVRAYGSDPWRIGIADPTNVVNGYPADATFCDVRIYDRALAAAEVSTLMRSTVEVAATSALTTDGTLGLGGGPFAIAGTLANRSGSLVRYTGHADNRALDLLAVPYHHLTVDNAGTAFSLVADAVVAGDLRIAAGTTLAAQGHGLRVAGDWTDLGTFTGGGGTVTLDGAGGTTQTIGGSTVFSALTATAAGARTLAFAAGATQTVEGALTLAGASGQRLVLRSTAAGSAWRLDPQGARVCAWLDVSDARNLRPPLILPAHSVDSGGTTWWFGQAIGLCWDGSTTGAVDGQTAAVSWPVGALAAGDVRTSGSGADAGRVFAVRNTGDQPLQVVATATSSGWSLASDAGVDTCALAIAPAATFTGLDAATSPTGVPVAAALAEGAAQAFRLRLTAPVGTTQGGVTQTLTITLSAGPPP